MSEKKRASFSILWLILTIVFAILTIVSIVGASILNIYSAAINAYFNVLPYKLVDVDPNETVDSEYYKSAFVTANGNYDDEGLYDYDLRVSQQIVNEGSVMLWNNDNALPLNKGAAVSCFSNTSVNMVYTGTGSGSISTAKVKTFKDGLLQYDFKVNETLWDFYESGAGSKKAGYGLLQKGSSGIGTGEALTVKEVPWNVISADSGVTSSFGSYGDAAIFVLGRSGGEGGDLGNNVSGIDTIGHDYLQLSEEEVSVLDNLINLKNGGTFKKVILIINSSNAMQMDMISDYADEIDACLWVGQPGAGGAPGIAKLLCGEATPSGHLVDTYCYDNDSSPAMVNFYVNRYSNRGSFTDPVTGGGLVNEQTAYTVYQEGIYVGYKYYETRYEDVVLNQGNAGDYDYASTVAYPFGYGLSYTNFAFSNYSVEKNKDGDYEVSVTVTNTGGVPGRQVAQIYLQKPYTQYDRDNDVEKSAVELVGFEKTGILDPGKSETLKITVDDQSFKTYDHNGYKTYILEEGRYYLGLGENAHDALNNILAAKKNDGVGVDASKMVDVYGNRTNGNAAYALSIDVANRDTETYSVSEHTGAEITNQFDFADINKYENRGDNSVTYMTRDDWTGTFPKAVPALTLNEKMVSDLVSKRDIAETQEDADAYYEEHGEIKYEQNNGYSLIQMKGLPYDAEEWDLLLDQMSWEEQAELCSNGYHTTALVESINKPATRDENGPLGISVTFSTMEARSSMGWPCEPTRAATFNKRLAELTGRCIGEDMLHAGVTGLWGYGLNIHRTPYSGRNFEYYSEDSFISGEMCAYETIGAQSKGAFIMVKHFAVNDSESQRHGNNVWLTEQTMRETYLSPFEKEFTKGKAWATMTSYNRIGTQWTGGSYALCTKVLRGEWGFMGYTSSDYAGGSKGNYNYFQNVYTGIQAGCDTYDANFHANEYNAVKDNDLFNYCLRISSKRICYAILHTSAMNGITSSTKVVYTNTWWQNALIAMEVGFGAITVVFGSLLVVSIVKNRKSGKPEATEEQRQ